ncbi:Nucleoplasmin core domain containing protein [Trema orientale]|uniref:Nucleoplasmin core domain containing protein n=1 Tax=Trema orientale TaxID=63057 RepID=A0A2P5DPQ7_TREOI|nr:Nucleoplasmin core domain containing protein [Trema orientale]
MASPMEFWGVEIKAGEPLTVEPEPNTIIHLSQAVLGETKSKGNEHVILSVKVGDKKYVLGNLSLDKFPQLSFDLVFEKEVELSHNWKNGSVYLSGYQTAVGEYPLLFHLV